MAKYTLKTGSHTWVDGKTYYAGGEPMELTKEQMERIGKERFEGQTPEEDLSNDIEKLREENRRLRARLVELGDEQEEEKEEEDKTNSGGSGAGNYSNLLSNAVPEITSQLQSIADLEVLDAIEAEESRDGRPRVGVLKAIKDRREALQG